MPSLLLGVEICSKKTSQEIFGDMADSRWLRTFNENLERVKKTKGFVLQIQQGVLRERSDMQVAEEMQSGWLQVPRIGYFAFPVTHVRGGGSTAEKEMEDAIAAAQAQWTKGVSPEVEVISPIFEPLEGELRFNAMGGMEGPARCTFPTGYVYEGEFKGSRYHGWGTAKYASGNTYTGQFENDKRHGAGTYTFANGDVFGGDYQDGLRHGAGTFTWADGSVAALIFEEDRPKGPGVRLEKASGLFYLLKDGRKQQQISQAEAQQTVKEHGLPELPW